MLQTPEARATDPCGILAGDPTVTGIVQIEGFEFASQESSTAVTMEEIVGGRCEWGLYLLRVTPLAAANLGVDCYGYPSSRHRCRCVVACAVCEVGRRAASASRPSA
jgi:hypothetical protein